MKKIILILIPFFIISCTTEQKIVKKDENLKKNIKITQKNFNLTINNFRDIKFNRDIEIAGVIKLKDLNKINLYNKIFDKINKKQNIYFFIKKYYKTIEDIYIIENFIYDIKNMDKNFEIYKNKKIYNFNKDNIAGINYTNGFIYGKRSFIKDIIDMQSAKTNFIFNEYVEQLDNSSRVSLLWVPKDQYRSILNQLKNQNSVLFNFLNGYRVKTAHFNIKENKESIDYQIEFNFFKGNLSKFDKKYITLLTKYRDKAFEKLENRFSDKEIEQIKKIENSISYKKTDNKILINWSIDKNFYSYKKLIMLLFINYLELKNIN